MKVYEDEELEKALKRFKKEVDDEGILKEWRERQYFMKPSLKKHQARRRVKRRMLNLQKGKIRKKK